MSDHSLTRLQDALDGRLPAAERAVVAAHLEVCEPCRRRERALRWTKVRLAGAADALPVPGDLAQQLARALDAAEAAGGGPADPPRPGWFTRWRR
ncbi:MAG: zf-HC2 domain-containing protein [Acidobacteria bacterium]|nr:zf-HC2 domain-containing protein [Acidobacteriota bacterium]